MKGNSGDSPGVGDGSAFPPPGDSEQAPKKAAARQRTASGLREFDKNIRGARILS
jgi:hypothetical protein